MKKKYIFLSPRKKKGEKHIFLKKSATHNVFECGVVGKNASAPHSTDTQKKKEDDMPHPPFSLKKKKKKKVF